MSRVRGKKLTAAQMKILLRHDNTLDAREWLYYGEEVVDDDGFKCTSKNSSKTKYLNVINRNTGEVKKLLI